jgi:cytochrome b6-f complex iron-sulfur subunit
MPLLDDLALPVVPEEMARRKFLGLLGSGALGAAALGTAITALRFLEPRVLFEEDRRFGVGRPEEFAPGTVLVLPKHKVYVVRTAEGFYAISSICTHLGCMTKYDKEAARFACPCHGSRFTLDGTVAAGPAPHPLPRLALSIERGVLVVDAGKRVAHDALLKVA